MADKFIDPSRIEAAATCATAGIIVGVVTLTGLGLKFSIIILSLAGSNLFLTVALHRHRFVDSRFAMPVTAGTFPADGCIPCAFETIGAEDL